MKKQIIFGHLGTLLFGGFIYILFRTTTLKMFSWYNKIGFLNGIENLRTYVEPIISKVPNWFLYSLPDGLWIFSYITLMLYIWKNTITKQNLFWIFVIPIVALISEIGQFSNIVPGTFDIIDILFYILGLILPFIIFKKSIIIKIQTV